MAAAAIAVTLVGGLVGAAPAAAQLIASYPYCLMTGPAEVCAYTSMAQCLAAKRGNADFCEPNNLYSNAASPRMPAHSRLPQ